MRNKTLKFFSKIMCLVLVATFAFEAPLLAAYDAIPVKVGGQVVNVTPGQWVTVKTPTGSTSYNVRYMDGKPVALEMSQYMKLVFGGETAGAAAAANTATTVKAPTTQTPVTQGSNAQAPATTTLPKSTTTAAASSNAGTVAENAAISASQNTTAAAPTAAADSAATTSGAKSGSWIKNELSDYGSKIKDSFTAGKETGNNFGNKTVDTVKDGASAVGTGVKSVGSKIGDLLRGAKDRIAKIFHKNPPAAKTDSAQSGQSGQSEQNGQSNQSGQSGQSEQNGQANQSEQTGQANQSEQSGQTGQANQSEQSGQSGQTGQADKPAKPGLKEVTATKFKAGYETGKAMVGEGVQNVKTSLKSGFSPKNLLMTAGITVGVDLATQIIKGEKPSFKKALKTVCCAEFAGGVVGSVTGAAAGSFFVPFLSAVPVVGGFLSALAPTFGSIVGGSMGAYLAGDIKNGRFSIKEAFKRIDWIGVGGQTVGSVLGTMLGSMIFPPFGTIIGGIVGGMAGNWLAHKIAGLFGKDNGAGMGNVAMPVGTNPFGSSDAGQTAGSVTIGGVAGGSEIPVSGDQASQPALEISGAAEPIGTYASEVQLAYAKYQELYRLYNEMLSQGRQEDATKVASEMNKAKAEYDTLKAKASN